MPRLDVDDGRDVSELHRLARFAVVDDKPTLGRPVSQTCTADQFDEDAYAYWCARIGEAPRRHRKQWEFCYIAQVLATSGALAPGRSGLGFGVGREPLVALFAAMGAKVLATDQAPETAARTGWIATAQHAPGKDGLNDRAICAPDLFERNVAFRFVDMNDIPGDIGGYDFIWSSCAFEHLGSIDLGHRFIVDSADLLRPGGIAVHTTELNCSSDRDTLEKGDTVLYRRQDIERMGRALAERGCSVDVTFDLGDTTLDRHVDVPPYSQDNHLKLKIAKWVTTSFGLVIRRP